MSSLVDWARLVAQNRAKSYGVRWTQEERDALTLGIPADYVRKGCLNLEDYEEMRTSSTVKTKSDLLKEAQEMNIPVTDEAPVEIIEHEIETVKIKKAKIEAIKTKIENKKETKTEAKVETKVEDKKKK